MTSRPLTPPCVRFRTRRFNILRKQTLPIRLIEYKKEIDSIQEKSKSDRERLQLEFDLRVKEMEAQSQNELVSDFFKIG